VKPYYERGGVTLYHGDLREIPEWLCADVLICDPPYGMGYRSFFRRSSSTKPPGAPIASDESTDLRGELLRLWGADKPAAIFGTSKVPRPSGDLQVLIWDKTPSVGPGMGDLSNAFGCSHEEIYLLGQWKKAGARMGSVLRSRFQVKALAEETGHPTPKPVDLLATLIKVAAPGVLADPCCGSGSLLVAAYRCGRKAIGIELDEQYCEGAAKRIDRELAQGDLFRQTQHHDEKQGVTP
jgi:hypothetical protein